jgi:hypothetical protein
VDLVRRAKDKTHTKANDPEAEPYIILKTQTPIILPQLHLLLGI